MTIVAIIGMDGCGKTTQAKMLADHLREEGYKSVYVRPVYVLLDILPFPIRSKLEGVLTLSPRKIRTTQPKSPRKYIIRILGYPYALLNYLPIAFYSMRNRVVICDRYFYQFFLDLYGGVSERVIKIFPKPDITLFLQGDIRLFYSRMNSSSDLAVAEDYYVDVSNLYKKIAQRYGFIQIDASLDKDSINRIILDHLSKSLKDKRNPEEANGA